MPVFSVMFCLIFKAMPLALDANKSKMSGKIKHVTMTMVDKVKIINLLKKLKLYKKQDECIVAQLRTLKLFFSDGKQDI
jgi:hypothetical protein